MMKRDISASLNQKRLILCSKILLNVLFNTSLHSSVTMATCWVPDPSYRKLFWPPFTFHFDICQQHFICRIQQAYRYVSSSFWPYLTFFRLKITYMLKSSGWGLEKSELPWEHNFFTAIGVFPAEPLACQVSMFCTANWPR